MSLENPASDASRPLVERATRGDPPALAELLQKHLPGLRAYLRLEAGALVRAKESCSDLVQSVCREVLGDLSAFEYRGEAAFRQWLYTAALRKVMDKNRYWQQDKRDAGREAHLDGDARDSDDASRVLEQYGGFYTPSHDASMKEQLARVERAFDALSPEYRQVVTLSRIVGLSHKEIAAQLGKTEVATRHLLARAMARLSTILDEGG